MGEGGLCRIPGDGRRRFIGIRFGDELNIRFPLGLILLILLVGRR